MIKTAGMIGLGIMGRPMAKNLLKEGLNLIVYDVSEAPVKELAGMGAKPAASPREMGVSCDVVFTMLPDAVNVEEALFGENGAVNTLAPNSFVIDSSSISPRDSRRIAEKVFDAGCVMYDAPVSGGEPKAVDGTLSFMVGGPEAYFETVREVMLKMGASAVRIGDNGSGCVCKLANQIIVNLGIAAMSEAFVLSAKAGVDVEKVFQAIRGGLAGSSVLDAKAPMILKRNFAAGGRININLKDIKNVMSEAHALDVPLPFTSQLLEVMQALKVDGREHEDHCAIIKYFEKLAAVEVK
jgi:2-hydroxy-3-oxopropionate reductase